MFDFQPTLSGDLLTLRPQVPEDWDALFAVASDPAIWAMHPMRERYREPVFRAFFDDALADRGGLVARDRADGTVFGFSRYSELFADPGEVEIGWTFLACDRWGGGWNREMKKLMLGHAFGSYDSGHLPHRRGQSPIAPRSGEDRRRPDRPGAGISDGRRGDPACDLRDREGWFRARAIGGLERRVPLSPHAGLVRHPSCCESLGALICGTMDPGTSPG